MPRIIGLIMLIMGCGFAAAGLTAGTLPWLKMMQHYWQARSYVPVQAQVLEVTLATQHKGMSRVQARYQYIHQNKTFVSARIGLGSEGADNLDDWHQSWVTRLNNAKEQAQTITAWVNPVQPQEAVLDRSMRWSKFVFLIPFAVLFPLVGIALIVGGLLSVLGNGSWVNKFNSSSSKHRTALISSGSTTGLWLFATFWNLLSWPIAAVVWMRPGDLSFVHFLVAIFPAFGAGLLWAGIKAARTQARQQHMQLMLSPTQARVGQPLTVSITFDEAMTHRVNKNGHQRYQLSLVCNADDRSSSSSSSFELWADKTSHSLKPQAAQAFMQHRFMPPANMPASGYNAGPNEVISWHVELLNIASGELMHWAFEMSPSLTPIASDMSVDSSRARAQASMSVLEREPYMTGTQSTHGLTQLPIRIVEVTSAGTGSTLSFPRRGWRVMALLATLFSGWMAWQARSEMMAGIQAFIFNSLALISLILAWYWASLRWVIQCTPAGLTIDRGSLFRSKEYVISYTQLGKVYLKNAYDMNSGKGMVKHYTLNVAATDKPDALIPVTPAIPHLAHAEHLTRQLWLAQFQAQHTFSLPDAIHSTRPFRQTSMYRGLMLLSVATSLMLMLLFISTGLLSKRFVPDDMLQLAKMQQGWALRLHDFTPQGRANNKLFDAQSRSDFEAVKQALKDGADASAKAAEGYTVLMFAARRGQTDIVSALLKAGADVNAKDEISTTNAGDTALLAAAYGGHIEVLTLLLDAGAKLSDKNMWGWNALHMAAQSSCVPCLELLHAKGVPLNDKATKSRGETPLMLAAAKNRIEAMQWLMDHGADLHERDPYGYDALGWANFFKATAETKAWITQRL